MRRFLLCENVFLEIHQEKFGEDPPLKEVGCVSDGSEIGGFSKKFAAEFVKFSVRDNGGVRERQRYTKYEKPCGARLLCFFATETKC